MSQRYLNSLLSLLPRGLFNDQSTNLKNLFSGIAAGFQEAEDFVTSRFRNLFPAQSDEENLLKWGRLTGERSYNLESLRILVERQLKKAGGASIDSFVSHIRALGLPFEEERILPTLDPFTCNSSCNNTVWSEDTAHAFGLRLPVNLQRFSCNSRCDRLLVQNQTDEVLDYLIGASPAHAQTFFFYDSEE